MFRMSYHRIIVVVIRKNLPGLPVVEDYITRLGLQQLPLLENRLPIDCIWSLEPVVSQTGLKVNVA